MLEFCAVTPLITFNVNVFNTIKPFKDPPTMFRIQPNFLTSPTDQLSAL